MPIDPNSCRRSRDAAEDRAWIWPNNWIASLPRRTSIESLLRELLEAQRNRKSEQLSKDQLALFEALWKARSAEDESAAGEDEMTPMTMPEPAAKPDETPKQKRGGAAAAGAASDAGTHRARSGGGGKALRLLRQGSAADRRGNQRTLRIHSRRR